MSERPLSITITPGTILTTIVILLLVWLAFVLQGLVLIVLTAIVLASAMEPGIHWFMKHRLPRALAVAVLYLIVLGTLFGIAYVFFPPLLQQTRNFVSSLPEYLNTLNVSNFVPAGLIPSSSPSGTPSSITDALSQLESIFTPTSEGAFRALSGIFGGVVSFIIIIVLSFYFAVEETGVDDFLRIVVPLEHQAYAVNLWKRSHRKIGLWIQGQLVLSCIMGIFAFLWLTILQVHFAFVLALVAATAELIPIFGPLIAGVTAVAVAAASEPTSTVLLVAVGFLVLHELEANLIYPLVVKKVVGVPPLLVILALFAGAELAGFFGLILSVPIAGAIQELVNDILKRNERELSHLKERA